MRTVDSDRRYIGRLRGTCKRTAQNFFIKFNKNHQSQQKFNPIASIFIQITVNIILEKPRKPVNLKWTILNFVKFLDL